MKTKVALSSLSFGVAIACGGASPPPPATPAVSAAPAEASTGEAAPGSAAVPTTFAEQVAQGQKLYSEYCASCHGDSGEGGAHAPAVVGLDKGALPVDPPAGAKFRKNQFKTVADIASFVTKAMPAKAPGSLKEEEYWSILAFDLKANGIDLADKKLDSSLASTLTVPHK